MPDMTPAGRVTPALLNAIMSTLIDQIEADFDAIVDLDEFTTDATWTDADEFRVTVAGWLNQPYSSVNINAGIEGGQITFRCLASAVPNVAQGQTVEIDDTVYDIIGVQPDGHGTVLLILSEQ